MSTEYYEILGVSREASTEDIRRAYRRLAREHHPDVNNGAAESEETFKRISEAYAVLSDEDKRRRYDLGGGQNDFFSGGAPDIWQIFESAFGGSPFGNAPRRGRSLQVTVNLELADVLTGVEREVAYNWTVLCEHCSGQGIEPGTEVKRCATCGGQGRVSQAVNTFLGAMTTVRECPACSGAGQIPDQLCAECHGHGTARRRETVTVQIPPGVGHGDELAVRGAGEQIPGGQPGDLVLRLSVKKHPIFTRRAHDLEMTQEVSYLQALLGDTLTVPTLTGETQVPLPSGTQPGAQLEVPGEGLPDRGGVRRGQLLVNVKVCIPRKLSEREHELASELATEAGLDCQPPAKGLFGRLRDSLGG
ncbi:MAG TPA: J domain-containing protein [Armatimonadota bacterium]|jgi:molecular chaperone DnaJ